MSFVFGTGRNGSAGIGCEEQLVQLRVLRLGLLQDGDVGVGVFPECEEVLVGNFCFLSVSRQHVSSAELKMREYTSEPSCTQFYLGRSTRRTRSAKRGSERIESSLGSDLSVNNQ